MAKKERGFEPKGLTIGYKELGTISIDELLHAIAADVHALKDIYGVKYVKAPRLKLFITNEYGEPVKVQRPTGGRIFYMDTHHYRPACLDYEL
ncbi:hypothetical protein [Tritonibacter mobilis]|jgi:hypothetical protein|uniref:hypothetical protein n=1 Tax=Tritonibacter mobilis TaxID=379347 RepID=UPI000806B81E|nr:hypothetical protein [Tritonibacter mobilis]